MSGERRTPGTVRVHRRFQWYRVCVVEVGLVALRDAECVSRRTPAYVGRGQICIGTRSL